MKSWETIVTLKAIVHFLFNSYDSHHFQPVRACCIWVITFFLNVVCWLFINHFTLYVCILVQCYLFHKCNDPSKFLQTQPDVQLDPDYSRSLIVFAAPTALSNATPSTTSSFVTPTVGASGAPSVTPVVGSTGERSQGSALFKCYHASQKPHPHMWNAMIFMCCFKLVFYAISVHVLTCQLYISWRVRSFSV